MIIIKLNLIVIKSLSSKLINYSDAYIEVEIELEIELEIPFDQTDQGKNQFPN